MRQVEIKHITNNLDRKRVPLNSSQRAEKETNPMYPYVGANNIMAYIDEYIFDDKILCIAEDGGSWGFMQNCAKIYNEKVWVNNHAHVLTAKEEVVLEYLMYYLNYTDLSLHINGATRGKLTKSSLNNIKVPLPPLEEQKKIAAILDAADDYRQKTKALINKYDQLTQSLFLDMFGDPVTNPMGWEVNFLKKITTKIGSGATPRGGKQAYKKEGVSLIRSMNIYDNRFKYKNLAFIDEDQAAKLKNVIVDKGDVLFNITGASICRSSVVPNDVLPARVNQHVSILRPIKSVITSNFLSRFLISKNVKTKLLGVGSGGGAVMEAITKEQLQNIEVIVPPIELQNQFAERVAQIEKQKQQAEASLVKAEELFSSMLQRAFKAELTN
jgi:type I restriction enzyme S subunit